MNLGAWLGFAGLLATVFVLVFLLYRAARRLIEFDEIFSLLSHDIETNVKHLDKLAETPLMSGSPEVQSAHRNMQIMNLRLKEYVLRMEELVNRRLRPLENQVPNPPRVA